MHRVPRGGLRIGPPKYNAIFYVNRDGFRVMREIDGTRRIQNKRTFVWEIPPSEFDVKIAVLDVTNPPTDARLRDPLRRFRRRT